MNTKRRIEEKVFSFIEEHNMLKPHDRVVVGVSGGADSVCLLFTLLEYAKKVPVSLAVVHMNHNIRQEAAEDARYVETLCRERGIPFYPFSVDVRRMAAEEKCSEEEAGRNARYQAFAQAAENFGADKIAVAHNCNDRSETLLFHLFRGSGIKGMGSIRPVRENIIRPILCLERGEVEAYLTGQGIAYCRDATNEQDEYTRNRIRHHIIPYAEQEIVAGAVAHMAQAADILSETEDYLEQQTATAMEECVKICEAGASLCKEARIDIVLFMQNHTVIRKRILYAVIGMLASSTRDISGVHVRDVLSLFTENGNRMICLPYGISARREYDKVIFNRGSGETDKTFEMQIPMHELSEGRVFRAVLWDGAGVLECRLLEGDCLSGEFPTNPYTKWLDYDKIEKSLVLRTRKTGDYLTVAGKDGQIMHKVLKDYMITEKIPRAERDRIPLLAEGEHVIWLIGYRISEYYKIHRNTKRILQVQLIGEECNSNETEEKNGRTC